MEEWRDHYLRYKQLKKLIGRLFPKRENDDEDENDEEQYVMNYQSDYVADRKTGALNTLTHSHIRSQATLLVLDRFRVYSLFVLFSFHSLLCLSTDYGAPREPLRSRDERKQEVVTELSKEVDKIDNWYKVVSCLLSCCCVFETRMDNEPNNTTHATQQVEKQLIGQFEALKSQMMHQQMPIDKHSKEALNLKESFIHLLRKETLLVNFVALNVVAFDKLLKVCLCLRLRFLLYVCVCFPLCVSLFFCVMFRVSWFVTYFNAVRIFTSDQATMCVNNSPKSWKRDTSLPGLILCILFCLCKQHVLVNSPLSAYLQSFDR